MINSGREWDWMDSFRSCPARTRTLNACTKNRCVTITPRDKKKRGKLRLAPLLCPSFVTHRLHLQKQLGNVILPQPLNEGLKYAFKCFLASINYNIFNTYIL